MKLVTVLLEVQDEIRYIDLALFHFPIGSLENETEIILDFFHKVYLLRL